MQPDDDNDEDDEDEEVGEHYKLEALRYRHWNDTSIYEKASRNLQKIYNLEFRRIREISRDLNFDLQPDPQKRLKLVQKYLAEVREESLKENSMLWARVVKANKGMYSSIIFTSFNMAKPMLDDFKNIPPAGIDPENLYGDKISSNPKASPRNKSPAQLARSPDHHHTPTTGTASVATSTKKVSTTTTNKLTVQENASTTEQSKKTVRGPHFTYSRSPPVESTCKPTIPRKEKPGWLNFTCF
jgi:hypothetical protein